MPSCQLDFPGLISPRGMVHLAIFWAYDPDNRLSSTKYRLSKFLTTSLLWFFKCTFNRFDQNNKNVFVVVQFYPWFKFYFPLFWVLAMYDNKFKTKENKI